MARLVPRRVPIAVLAAALCLVPAASASAQEPGEPAPAPVLEFAHDPAVETTSGFHSEDPASGDALATRPSGTFETYSFEVPENTRHGTITVRIEWPDPRVNLDLALYREGPTGEALAPALARSTSTARRASEAVAYAPSPGTVEPGRYVVVVDNYCSRDADDDPRTDAPDRANCGIQPPAADEDAFEGTITLGNQLPTVALTVPEGAVTGQPVTITANAEDRDGSIDGYWFDLDGDGIYEEDADGIPRADATFDAPGTYSVGVQVLDDDGAAALARASVVVRRARRTRAERDPIWSFRANVRSFGGRQGRRLAITYRLRERARVSVSLRRGGRHVRRIAAGVRRARRSYRIVLKPARLRRGVYTVRLTVLGASGKRQTAELTARRR
jgi:hypothetical protein